MLVFYQYSAWNNNTVSLVRHKLRHIISGPFRVISGITFASESLLRSRVNPGKEQFKQVKFRSASTTKQKCERYNGPPHSRMKCPARDSSCNNCLRKGHWKKACRSKTVSKVTAELQDTTQQLMKVSFFENLLKLYTVMKEVASLERLRYW